MTTINQLTRDQIITAAIGQLGVLAIGQTPDTEDITKAALFLNTLLSELRALGMPLWARKEYSFSPVVGTNTYEIGVSKTLDTPYPLKMLQAYINVPSSSNVKVQMDIISDYNFNYLPSNSNNTGSPINLTYQPLVNYGKIKIWPTPDSSNSTISIIYQRPFEYFTNGTDVLDMPEEWYNTVIYKLAVLLAPAWGIPLQARQQLRAEAKEMLDSVLSMGGEDASIYFMPER